jgi:hypothetical protein
MSKTAATIIASAIIWGIVLIAVASALKGTEYSEGVRNIIAAGAAAHLLMLGATARRK